MTLPNTPPEPDHHDSEQNAFVQDWLSAWQKEIPTDSEDYDKVEATIEMIQETYAPKREPDIKVTEVYWDAGAHSVEVWGKDIHGRLDKWILLHYNSQTRFHTR